MKKIKYFNIALVSFLAIFLSSCVDDKRNDIDLKSDMSNIATFEDYFEFINTETKGSILIQSLKTSMSEESFSALSSIDGNRAPLKFNLEDSVIDFIQYHYSESSNKSFSNKNLDNMSDFFGSELLVNLSSQNVEVSKVYSENNSNYQTVYIPKLINVEFSGLQNGKLVVGSKVVWNFDGNNEKGVVIGLEYNPLAQLSQDVKTEKSDRLLKGITLPDNGEYIIKKEDLEEFPSDALITVYVGRAGYDIALDDEGNDYSLAGLTVYRRDLQLVK